jgi:hypothetical protein
MKEFNSHPTLGFSSAARTHTSYLAGDSIKKDAIAASAASHCSAHVRFIQASLDTPRRASAAMIRRPNPTIAAIILTVWNCHHFCAKSFQFDGGELTFHILI